AASSCRASAPRRAGRITCCNSSCRALSPRIPSGAVSPPPSTPIEEPDMKRLALGLAVSLALCRPVVADAPTELKGHQALVYSVAFSPDGKLLATAGFDNVVKI